jgi:hypothetical protein
MEAGHTLEVAHDMVLSCLRKDVPTMLWGPPGMGKTDLVEQVGLELDWPVVDETLSTMDPTDLRGVGIPGGGHVVWEKPDWLYTLESFGDRPTILFLDEINAGTSQAMLAAALKLILKRCAGPHPLPKKCRIIGAGNRQIDRASVTKTTAPTNNRLEHLDVIPDLACWQKWANRNQVEPLLCAYLNWQHSRGNNAFHVMDDPNARAFPTGRSWVQAAKFVRDPDSIRQALIAGQVGQGQASEFDGFLRLHRSLVPLDQIIRDPAGAPVPNEPAMLYAVAAGLARKATMGNFRSVTTYAERMPAEFCTVVVSDAVRRDETLKQAPGYTDWAIRHQDVVL